MSRTQVSKCHHWKSKTKDVESKTKKREEDIPKERGSSLIFRLILSFRRVKQVNHFSGRYRQRRSDTTIGTFYCDSFEGGGGGATCPDSG